MKSVFVKVCVRYGLVAGALALILFVTMFYIGHHPLLIAPYLDFRVLLFGVFIFFALREYRDYYQNGLLYFWQGLIGSFVVVLLSSVIAAFGLLVFGKLESSFVSSYIAGFTAYLQTYSAEDIERLGKEIYERNLAELPSTNVGALAITYFAQGMIIGFFVSIILSVILRKTT